MTPHQRYNSGLTVTRGLAARGKLVLRYFGQSQDATEDNDDTDDGDDDDDTEVADGWVIG